MVVWIWVWWGFIWGHPSGCYRWEWSILPSSSTRHRRILSWADWMPSQGCRRALPAPRRQWYLPSGWFMERTWICLIRYSLGTRSRSQGHHLTGARRYHWVGRRTQPSSLCSMSPGTWCRSLRWPLWTHPCTESVAVLGLSRGAYSWWWSRENDKHREFPVDHL